MDGKFKNNVGLQKAMALDTLGNAYLHLRDQATQVDGKTLIEEYTALLDAARILRTSFRLTKHSMEIHDFTIPRES